jgi:hypothetical protein
VIETTPPYPPQPHDFKKKAKGSVVVMLFMFSAEPSPTSNAKTGEAYHQGGETKPSTLAVCMS